MNPHYGLYSKKPYFRSVNYSNLPRYIPLAVEMQCYKSTDHHGVPAEWYWHPHTPLALIFFMPIETLAECIGLLYRSIHLLVPNYLGYSIIQGVMLAKIKFPGWFIKPYLSHSKSPCLMLKLSSTLPVMAWFRGSVQLAQPDDGCVDWICLDSGGDLPSGYD